MSRILIVDDDVSVQGSLQRILERAGHEVRVAMNGLQALQILAEAAPDLVITDVLMPEMDGIELIGKLTAHDPPIPVVAVSGGGKLPKEVMLDTAGALGAVHTLEKPFEVEDLLAIVDEALAARGAGPE